MRMRYFVYCICLFWGLSSCKYLDRNANFIPKEEVWKKINLELREKGLIQILSMPFAMLRVV